MKVWMNGISDSVPLSEINIPGTHDSCARYVAFPHFSKCHNLSVASQLEMGIRLFDMRVEKKGNELICVHAIVNCKDRRFFGKTILFGDVIKDCTDFLKNNPSETVIICFKRDDGAGDEETFRLFSKKYLNEMWYTGSEIPALGQVRGKLVLMNRCFHQGDSRGFGLDFTHWCCGDPTKSLEPNIQGNGIKYYIQDNFQASPKNKWSNAVKPMLDAEHGEGIILNFFSANDSVHSPAYFAKYIEKRLPADAFKQGKKYGWLLFDYPKEYIVDRLIKSNM